MNNMNYWVRNGCWLSSAVLLAVSLMTASQAAAAVSDAEKKQVCLEMTTLFRSARGVISANQELINDASKGDKGLSGDAVVGAARENFLKATGSPLPAVEDSDTDSLANLARAAMLSSISEIMGENQAWINEKGKGFKGFLPAIFAKLVADRFSEKMQDQMFIRLTAPKEYVRNRANRPDEWELKVIEESFKAANHEKGKEVAERALRKGQDGYRLMIPEYYKQSCLKCHGEPKGERDITGGKKEGGKLGELGGAISVGIFD